jgi:hypothetical protein
MVFGHRTPGTVTGSGRGGPVDAVGASDDLMTAPTQFWVSIFGGPQGLLVNNTNLCGSKKKGKQKD